jgi:hypothetical protein
LTEVKKSSKSSLLGTLMMASFFPTTHYFCCKRKENQQNDQVYSVLLRDISQKELAVERYQSVSRIMVWFVISKKSKLLLLFIDSGVKIDQHYLLQTCFTRLSSIYSNMFRTHLEKIIFPSNKTLRHLILL